MDKGKDLRDEFPTLMDRAYALFRERRFVEDIMSRDVVTIIPEATMAEAARVMGAMRVGSLIVVDKDEVQGIVTERDLLSRIIAEDRDPECVTVREVMSSPLITIKATASIKEAAQDMISKKGRLAVFQEGELKGIVTAADLVKSLPEAPETLLNVDQIMTKSVVIVPSETTVEEAAKIMGKKRIGSILVAKEGEPYGIFTERDLLTTFITRGRPLRTTVGEAAASPLITIPSGTSIHQTALTMALKHVRRLPIVEDGAIIGIITARDLVEAYAK